MRPCYNSIVVLVVLLLHKLTERADKRQLLHVDLGLLAQVGFLRRGVQPLLQMLDVLLLLLEHGLLSWLESLH